MNDAVPGKPVTFKIQATGTKPLKYQWQHKTGDESGGWQLCDVGRFPGANSSTLTIPSVQKSDEGSFHCTVSNCAGSETSEYATLIIGESIYPTLQVIGHSVLWQIDFQTCLRNCNNVISHSHCTYTCNHARS